MPRTETSDTTASNSTASGTRPGSSSLAGVRLAKIGWSGSATTTRPWTAANRIVPNRTVGIRRQASRWRTRTAAGIRIAATPGVSRST